MLRFVLCTVLTLLVAAPAGYVSAADYDEAAARSVFEDRCSKCHHVDRALKKSKDRAGWEKTVTRMKDYAGGMISDADLATIVDFLTRTRSPAQ